MENNYLDFIKYAENMNIDKMEMVLRGIEGDINNYLYKSDSDGLRNTYCKLQELRKKIPAIDNYSRYMEKESVYFYAGMVYAYYNMCGMYYTKVRNEEEKDEIQKFNKDCYKKLKEYLYGRDKVDEDTLESELGISKNKIMTCITTLSLVGYSEVNNICIDGKVYYFLNKESSEKEEFRRKVGDGNGSITIDFQ